MMDEPLLDVAAFATLIYAVLTELPASDVRAIAPLLERSLELAGVKDISGLQLLKANGQSVFGEAKQYPQASSEDVANLLNRLQDSANSLSPLPDPGGLPVSYDSGSWTPITAAIAPTITLEDLRYVAS